MGKGTGGEVKGRGALSSGGGGYADLGTGFGFERTVKVSYGAWVYPASKEAMAILSRMDDDSAFRGWDLYLSEGKVYVHLVHQWDQNVLRIASKNPIEINQWHHLFVTYDGSSKAKGLKLYINGKPAEVEVTHDTLTDTIRTPKPLRIGRRNPSAPFHGMIDEVRIYDRELSAAEVEQLAGFDTIRPILATAPEKRTKEQRETLAGYYLENLD